MRILTVTTSYPRHPGDWAGRCVRDLNAGLVALGHDVATLAPWAPGLAPHEEDTEAGPLRRVRAEGGEASAALFYGSGAEANARSLGFLRSAVAFRAATQAFEPAIAEAARGSDLVLAHWVFPSAWWAAKAARGVPIVGVLHGADARLLRRPVVGRLAARRLRGRLERLVCTSPRGSDSTAARLAVPPGHVVVSPMGLDASVFRPGARGAAERGLVAAAGRLVPSKGFDRLVASCAGLEATLVIAGEGPERGRLAREAAARGVVLDLPGTLDPSALADLFRRASVVAAPSRGGERAIGEGTPLVVLEALACGAAVVGTRTGGLPGVLGSHALAADDPASLRALLVAALRDPDRFRDAGAVTRFDRVAVARRVLERRL